MIFTAQFWRRDEAEPYHSWASFAATDVEEARGIVETAWQRAQALGGTLGGAERWRIVEAEGGGVGCFPPVDTSRAESYRMSKKYGGQLPPLKPGEFAVVPCPPGCPVDEPHDAHLSGEWEPVAGALLGMATTRELLLEIQARGDAFLVGDPGSVQGLMLSDPARIALAELPADTLDYKTYG